MSFQQDKIHSIVQKHYGINGSAVILPGELDLNYYIEAKEGRYIFKIANIRELHENLLLQHSVINHLCNQNFGLTTSSIIKTKEGEEIIKLTDDDGNARFARLLTWIDGRVFAKVNPHSPLLLQRLGEMCGLLCASLQGFDNPAAHRFLKWDPSRAAWIKEHLAKFEGERKKTGEYFFRLFEKEVVPNLPKLRQSVNYNDANDYNVLVSNDLVDPKVNGVIDFGDVVYTHTVNELAVAIAYAAMDKPNPLEAACHVVRGFNDKFKLNDDELICLFPLIGARLMISVVCSELNRLEHPENEYLQISDRAAWDLLEKLKNISPAFAHYSFRNACGLEPCPQTGLYESWARENHQSAQFPVDCKSTALSWLDLSVGSLDLGGTHEITDAERLDKKISGMISGELALGRYDEVRAIYATPAYEVKSNDSPRWRTVHIGLDFFCADGTNVLAALDGTVHSFANNNADRDYGPTIILKHTVTKDLTFYTLYGHLNVDSLKNLKAGKVVKAGEVIGQVGSRTENGNWTPHLHFQVILDMLDNEGDYPGVCTPEDLTVWKSLCPDPWLLLTGRSSLHQDSMPKETIVSFRKHHVGKNLSISYKEPIKMVRGAGQYLIDDKGKRYLDTVNNVAHVGHEHPRVVAAGQRQMAVLNTNTRYLHENLVLFVDELLSTMPAKLNVVFLVNSGSEANELAMRIAKTCTGQTDMIVSQVGYHGNTNGCIDISSYKFDGKGGKGKPPHVHVIPIPDTYRGLYRSDDLHAGSKYAGHVREAIASMQANNRKPAALIFESVISCGGQVELPHNFLKEAYDFTRAAGGVCVADEVQTGCGRAGDQFWAFQQHDVVPDIVTIGKPIGNGHPLGAVVTTQELADAFKNGMEYFNTFGGNPVSCAIGLEVLRTIKDEDLQENAKTVGDYLKTGLRELMNDFEIIGDVRGPGMFIGFELVTNRITKVPATQQANYFANRMRDKGILMSTDGPYDNVLKIKPPIVFSKNDSDFLLESIRLVLKEDFMRMQPSS